MDILKKYFHLTPHQEQQFAALGELYPEWNQKINVISRKDTENLQHPPFTALPFPNPAHGLRPPGEKFYSWGRVCLPVVKGGGCGCGREMVTLRGNRIFRYGF